jgi:uncharacterized membrane protein
LNLNQRFWEIDFLRGTAVILMIIFHFLFDLYYFGIYPVDIISGFLWYLPRFIAGIFIFLVGISLYLSYSRMKKSNLPLQERDFLFKYIKRGVWIFSLGLIITLATWLFLPSGFIIFGILHFIGLAIILAYPLLKLNEKYKYMNMIMGLIIIISGVYLNNMAFDFNWLLWLGFIPQNLYTLDYFPILPWLGVVCLGIFTGSLLYNDYKRKYIIPDLSGYLPVKIFDFLGRHSLIIYFIHQPILIGVLYYLGFINLSLNF